MAKQKNLDLSNTYSIVSSRYSEDKHICENCGATINNIAVVKSSKNIEYMVGMDCANTLTLSDTLEGYIHKTRFDYAKSIRSKIRKYQSKVGNNHCCITALVHQDSNNYLKETGSCTLIFELFDPSGSSLSRGWIHIHKDVWESHVHPMIKDQLSMCLLTK